MLQVTYRGGHIKPMQPNKFGACDHVLLVVYEATRKVLTEYEAIELLGFHMRRHKTGILGTLDEGN